MASIAGPAAPTADKVILLPLKIHRQSILPIMNGLGGREVSLEEQKEQLKTLVKFHETGELPKDMIHGTFWSGLLEVE